MYKNYIYIAQCHRNLIEFSCSSDSSKWPPSFCVSFFFNSQEGIKTYQIKGPDNPTSQLRPIISKKCCSGDGDGRKDKGGGGGKMVCDKAVCVCQRWCGETWCVPKMVWWLCVKDGVGQSCVWKMVCQTWCVTKWCVKDGEWKMACDGVWKMACQRCGVKDGMWKMVCDKVVCKMMCERWCVTKWCDKDGV